MGSLRKNWLLLIALIALLAFWGLALTGTFPAPQQHQQVAKISSQFELQESVQDRTAEALARYTELLAGFTFLLFLSTVVQGCLIWRQIRLAREEFIASHRPKLRVRLVRIAKPTPGNPVTVQFTVANVGDSEALNVVAKFTMEIFVTQATKSVAEFDVIDKLAPGEPHQVEREMSTIFDPHWADVPWSIAGDIRIHGHVSYTDRNGIGRRTAFYRFATSNLNRFRLPDDADIERDYEYED